MQINYFLKNLPTVDLLFYFPGIFYFFGRTLSVVFRPVRYLKNLPAANSNQADKLLLSIAHFFSGY